MKILIASILSLVFFSLAVIHVYWGFWRQKRVSSFNPNKRK